MEFKKVNVDGETIYLKKSNSFGWKVIHPVKNEDGSINWKNLICGGTYWNLVIIAVFLIVFLGCIWEYSYNFKECSIAMGEYNFELRQNQTLTKLYQPDINFTKLLEVQTNDTG